MSDILKPSTRSQKTKGVFLQMFSDVLFHLEIVSTNVTEPTQSVLLSMWKRHLKHCIVNYVVNISRKEKSITEHVRGTTWASIIKTYLINLLSTGPLQFSPKIFTNSQEL